MSDEQLPEFIKHLLNPSAYAHEAVDVKLVQTHISYVLLAGDHVYKFKKPVDFGFLDFTTLEKRHHYCEQELLLNRRLCPSIYQGLVALSDTENGLVLSDINDASGIVVEYGVKMARMPEDRMMANVINAGQLTVDLIENICDTLIPFYEKADGGNKIKEFGTSDSVSVNVLENFEQTENFIGGGSLSKSQFENISGYAKDFLKMKDLFEERIAQRRIRDCHGDLYSANICLADQVYIYDCIEFNQRFRYCDVASDVAFLAMDLDFHGLDNLSRHFINRFQKLSGDDGLTKMLNFYKCYRAYVRGKIGLFTAHSPEVDDITKQSSLEQAGKYFFLAERYATE